MICLIEQYNPSQVQQIFKSMLKEFEKYGDELDFDSYHTETSINWLAKNNRRTLGRCKYEYDVYRIFLNPNMLNFEDDGEKVIRNTLAHELCHTLPGCLNHGKEFHRKAKMIYDLMGYVIDTTADVDSSEYFSKYLPDANYKIICNDCGNEILKNHISDPINNPGRYTCSRCGGSVSSYKLNKQTGEYELYRSPEDTLQYKYQYVCPDCGWVGNQKTRNKRFSNNIEYLNSGHYLICPKCESKNLYIVDDGTEIHMK